MLGYRLKLESDFGKRSGDVLVAVLEQVRNVWAQGAHPDINNLPLSIESN